VALFVSFLIIILTGLPISFAFGVSGLFFLLNYTELSPNILPSISFASIDSFPLMAIPFFIFAGDIMRYGGVSRRLISFAKILVQESRAALGNISVIASSFFGAISGSSAATVAAIGSIMIPEMERNGYEKKYAVSLASAAGYLGILIPPSIPLVVYGVTAEVSIGDLFLAGVGPGIIATLAFVLLNTRLIRFHYQEPKAVVEETAEEKPNPLKVTIEAVPGLVMPLIILGGIYSGIFSATEAAAVALIYGVLISTLIYKEIKLSDLISIAANSALTSATILIIIALAGFFGRMMTLFEVPTQISSFMLSISSSPVVIILLINLFLLILGMIMETSTAILITTPILLPIAASLGIDPIHFGVMVVFNLAVGLITPPMALNMFIGSQISGVPVSDLVSNMMPFVLVSLIVLLLVIFIPQLSLFIPGILQ